MEAWQWISKFPVTEYAKRFSHDITTTMIKSGPMPQHIAFVMDGNRRYAKQNKLEAGEGHYAGFETMLRILHACQMLGIRTVTVYAFSIENFHRSREESDLLFNLIRTKMWDLVKDDTSVAQRAGWKVNVLGHRAMLEKDVLERIEQIEEATKNNDKLILNICCPYTSRDDMTHATQSIVREGLANGVPDSIPVSKFEKELYMADSGSLDILVRTSGAARLSDFMCWESVGNCQVDFVPTLWPDFSVWELYSIVIRWSFKQTRKTSTVVDLQKLPPAPPAVSVSKPSNRT